MYLSYVYETLCTFPIKLFVQFVNFRVAYNLHNEALELS